MKPIIRTITGFISVNDFPKIDDIIKKALTVKANIEKSGYEVQTINYPVPGD